MGASCARSVAPWSALFGVIWLVMLTLTVHTQPIDGCTADHDIVNDGETAFTSHPITLAVLDATVGQYRSFIEPHTAVMKLLGDGYFIRVEESPY